MGITRPTGEQLRFRSQYTGDHILDTYLESSEKGSRQLSDLLDDLFDSNGTFRSGNFEFRFDASSDKIQFRAGNFASSTTGWTDITTFFNITGAFNASTTYNNFDLITLTNKDVYIVHGLSSGTTFADEAAVIASANTEKLVDVSEARDWASKTTGQVVSTDYSAKAYAVGGTGIDTTTGSAKDWAIKTSGTIGNTGEYSAKYWATSTAVTTVSSGIANINTVAASIANVNTVASDITNVNTVAGISANVTSVANIDTDVTTVAGISANTTTVAGIAPNVTTVAGVATNVTTVAGISGNVTTVANNNTNVTTVATNVADVNTVATEINNNNLQTVANDIQAVITLANDLNEATSEIDTVANSITNVDAVGNDITNVNTVATNIANVNTSATNIANVNTVAGISANVTTVAGISADVTTTATNNANITTVAGISSNVTTVAGISSDVTTVAGISADVTTAATNVVAFNNTYLGASATAPTADPDGSALDLGDLYFDTSTNTMKVYSSSGWTNAGSSVNGTADRFTYTATAGQTTFTGADDSNNTLAYDAGFIDIYMNGVKLAPADYTATSGTSVVLASGAALNDVLEMIAYGTFTLSNQSINDMTDVSTSGVANNNLLAYNSTNSQFEPVSSINFGDNDKAIFGAGNDLQIYHDGGNSLIQDAGTGDLILKSNGAATVVKTNAGNNLISARDAGSVGVFYDGSEKLTTTSTGIDVTGTIEADKIVAAVGGSGTSLSTDRYMGVRNTGGDAHMQVICADTTGLAGITFGRNSDNVAAGMAYDASNHAVLFYGHDYAERMRITSAGNVGIGVTSSTARLKAYKNNQVVAEIASATNGHLFISQSDNYTDGFEIYQQHGSTTTRNSFIVNDNRTGSKSAAFLVRGDGKVGVSTESPTHALTIGMPDLGDADLSFRTATYSSIGAIKVSHDSGTAEGSMRFHTRSGGSEPERMRINNLGDVMFNTTDPDADINNTPSKTMVSLRTSSEGIRINQTGASYWGRNGDGGLIGWRRNGVAVGSIAVASSGTTYLTTSDRRLKTDIQPIEHATDMLMAMNPVTHRWKADPDADAVVGFIAQEMHEIVPEAVSGEPEGEEMMSMDYGRITPVLVAALQDAHKKIEALEARINEMEAK